MTKLKPTPRSFRRESRRQDDKTESQPDMFPFWGCDRPKNALRMTGTRTSLGMAGTRTGPGMAGAQAACYRDGRRWISILPASVLSYSPAKEAEPAPWAKTGTSAPEWPKDDQLMPAFRPRMRVAVTERGS